MKVTFLLTLLTTLHVSAVLYSQEPKLNLTVKDKSLKDVIKLIEQQSNYRFFFSDNYQDLNNVVSLNTKDQNIDQVLSNLLDNKSITYKILENNIVVITPKEALQQRITGTVADATNGEALPGVSILIEGTSSGAITDVNGKFSIDVPNANAVLVFTFMGYLTERIPVSGQTTLEVKLSPDVKKLEEVVVIGYGTQKKSDVTGATVHVDEKVLHDIPAANLQQALQGRAAGLEIQRTGTIPGAGAQLRIRGMRSIMGSNDPLLVVDGIPFDGNINDLNIDDIASIDILKDASATAIYGSRGANGVILITSKKGQNDATHVSYNGYYGIGTVAKKYPVFSADEYVAMRNTSTWTQGYQPMELAVRAAGLSTDWQNEMYQQSFKTDQNLTVSGGNAGNTYSLGGGYYKETTVLPGQDFTRYSIRANIDSKIGKRITIGLSSLNSVGVTNGSQFVNPMFPVLATSPLMMPYVENGKINYLANGDVDDNNSPQYNPLLLKHNNNNWVDRVRRLRTINSLYGEYQILNGLKYRANLGLTYSQQEDDQFQSGYNPDNPSYFRGFKGNTASVNNTDAWGYTIENLLTYEKTIANDHKISVTAMYSTQEFHQHNTYVSKDSINADFVQFYNLAASNPTPAAVVNGGETSWALLSYMGRINYSYKDRYLLTVTGRRDGSSRLAPGHKWHEYPAVSAGWKINEEPFMKSLRVISSLKLRAGFGQTSNQAINPYQSLGLVSNGNGLASPANIVRYNYGPTIVTGYGVSNLPNPNLDWEYTQTVNIGLDFGVLDNRISGTVEYYLQKTNGILNNVTLPPTSGVSGSYLTNVGKMENKGLEVSITSRNIESRTGFSWSTDFNLFFNRNKLVRLTNGTTQDITNQLFQGYSMTSIYDYKKLGIWQLGEAAQAAQYGCVPGQIKLADISGPNGVPDGKIDPNYDRSVIGNSDAKVQGGMTNRFFFKGIDLSFVVYARLGGTLISQIHQPSASYLTNMDGKRNGIKVDYWTPTNPSNWFPYPGLPSISPISTAWTTLGYYDASFVKIRSINLGYTFSPALVKRINIKSVRFYLTLDNVATLFSPYMKKTGIDPEGNAVGNQGVGNPGNIRNNNNGNGSIVITNTTPATRTLSLGANITF